MTYLISVICDRCRAQGLAGEDPFEAFGALLDFEPVPRLKTRADGWDAEVQRAYIAALSLTGSDRAACRAVGKSQFGVTQLLAHAGSEGFRAAREEALAIAADERSRRLAEGLRAVATEQSGWRPPDPPWAHAASRNPPRARLVEGPAESEEELEAKEEAKWQAFMGICERYVLKLQSERRCRLEGRIAEADFYVRQATWLECALDCVGGDGMALLRDYRAHGYDLREIAETPMSQILRELREAHFNDCGDPPWPEHPPRHLLVDQGGFKTVPMYPARPQGMDRSEHERATQEQYAKDAAAQIEWEARARRDFENRRDSAT